MRANWGWIAGVVFAAAAVGVGFAMPAGMADLLADCTDLFANHQAIAQARADDAEIDRQLAAIQRRHVAKQKIIADLLADSISFTDAAAEFKRLNSADPVVMTNLDRHYRAFPRDERFCRNLIDAALNAQPDASQPALAQRLAQALDKLRRNGGGTVKLPD